MNEYIPELDDYFIVCDECGRADETVDYDENTDWFLCWYCKEKYDSNEGC